MCTNKVPCPAPDGSIIYRPCGKCLDCLRQYQQDWTCRLDNEFKAWQSGSVIFFTLTYEDNMLPVMVTYEHPISFSIIQSVLRKPSVSLLSDRLSKLGLDSFYYSKSLREDNSQFRLERRALRDSYLDMEIGQRPILCVPTVNYSDVNQWIRYCRKYFDRHEKSVTYKDRRVNPYLRDLNFRNIHGVVSDYPDSAYTPSFKYFITSEYGPSTLRPHYHGVLYGVSEEMFRDVFAPYWRQRFGNGSMRSVEYSVWDISKGGSMYIAKYCSKGQFEHPLIKTLNIRYNQNEFDKPYYAKTYVNNVMWFDMNFPLCTPTFHLISKGIGVRYPFDANIQKYWNVQCDEFTGFVCKDRESHLVPPEFFRDFQVSDINRIVDESGLVGVIPSYSYVDLSLQKLSDRHRKKLIGYSRVVKSSQVSTDDFLVVANQFLNKKFIRQFYYDGTSQTFESLLPRYYRRFLLSPFSQCTLSFALRSQSLDDFNRERRQIKSFRQEDAQQAAIRQIEYSKAHLSRLSKKNLQSRFNKFYGNIFKGDMI